MRLLTLKHSRSWSYDELEREVTGSLVYRRFCRIDAATVPDAKTMVRLGQLLDGPALRALLDRLVGMARAPGITRGDRMRVDTTVVEAPIRHPTDSGMCEDAIGQLELIGPRARQVLRQTPARIVDAQTRTPGKIVSSFEPWARGANGSSSSAASSTRSFRGQVLVIDRQRIRYERQRWFQRGRAWRAGGEARISRLENTFGGKRSRCRGRIGVDRTIGCAAIANNLAALGRYGVRPSP